MAKRKLKDTKVGDWLRRKAPDVLDTVGEFLPEKGVQPEGSCRLDKVLLL